MPLVIATTNPGKLREIVPLLDGVSDRLVSLAALPPVAEPAETGTTFAENARLKAIYYAAATGLPCVADDSGLEVIALDGAPGVHSARWYGQDYTVKFQKISSYCAPAVSREARRVSSVPWRSPIAGGCWLKRKGS